MSLSGTGTHGEQRNSELSKVWVLGLADKPGSNPDSATSELKRHSAVQASVFSSVQWV